MRITSQFLSVDQVEVFARGFFFYCALVIGWSLCLWLADLGTITRRSSRTTGVAPTLPQEGFAVFFFTWKANDDVRRSFPPVCFLLLLFFTVNISHQQLNVLIVVGYSRKET